MNRPQVWKAFHDAFAALPADFLATVTMSSIVVDGNAVRLSVCVERAGKIWQVGHVEDMEEIRVRISVAIVARDAWYRLISRLGYIQSVRGAA